LTPYAEEDAPFFFGREVWSEILSDNLKAHRLTLLYGESGVGKSSVLRAGVAHRLREQGRRASAADGAPGLGVVVFGAWRRDPEAGLVRALDGVMANGGPRGGSLEDALDRCAGRVDGRVLLILDQFEEYFLYHPSGAPDGFGEALPAALERDDLRLSVLIGIREDALARLDRFQDSIPGLFDNYLRIEHLDRAAARRAIEGPLRRFNAARPGEPDVAIEPELIGAVLNEVEAGKVEVGEAGGGRVGGSGDQVETPYLQLVLTRLWEEELRAGSTVLRAATLERLGGAQGIVETHLDEAMKALPPADRDIAAAAFRYLVTPARTKVAQPVANLADWTDTSEEELLPVLERLSDSDTRILRPVAEGGYEIRHDVLADAVLEWRSRHDAERRVAAQRAAHRHRLMLIGRRITAVAFVAVVGLLVFALLQASSARKASRDAKHASARADGERLIAESRALASGAVSAAHTDSDLGLMLGLEALERAPTKQAVAALRTGLGQRDTPLTLGRMNEEIHQATYNRDGTRILTLGRDGVRLWDAARRTLVAPLSRRDADAQFSPDGSRVVRAHGGSLAVWDARTGVRIPTARGLASRASVSPDGRLVAVVRHSRPVVRSAASGRIVRVLPGSPGVTRVEFSTDGRRLSGWGRSGVTVWNLATRRMRTLAASDMDANISPDARRAVVLGRRPLLIDIAGGRSLSLPGARGEVRFSPDGRRFVTFSGGEVSLWSARTGARLALTRTRRDWISDVTVDPQGHRMALLYYDNSVRIWEPATHALWRLAIPSRDPSAWVAGASFGHDGRSVLLSGEQLVPTILDLSRVAGPVLPASPVRVPSASFGSGGRMLALAGRAGAVTLVEPSSGRRLGTLRDGRSTVSVTAFDRGGSRLLTMAGDGVARLWDPAARRVIVRMQAGRGKQPAGAFSPDGRLVVTATRAGGVRLWRTGERSPLRTLAIGHAVPRSVAFSRDGTRLIVGNDDSSATIWNVATGRRLAERRPTRSFRLDRDLYFVPHPGAQLSPDGTRLLMLGPDGALRVWNQRGRLLAEHRAPEGDLINGAEFSPDGRLIAAASDDSRVHLYDARTLKERFVLRGAGQLGQVAFSPDGAEIATAGSDDLLRVWELGSRWQILSARLGGRSRSAGFSDATPQSVRFSPDGRHLVMLGTYGPARVFRCDGCAGRRDLARLAHARIRRELTATERRDNLDFR
jgi:WD40 repeat protein